MTDNSKKTKVNEPVAAREKGSSLTFDERQTLLKVIKKRYEKQGSVNKLALARELKINRGTLLNLIKELDIEMEDLPTIKIELKLIYNRLRDRALHLLERLEEISESNSYPMIKEELAVMREIQNIVNNFYKLLQEIGEAPKVAENLNIREERVNININIPQDG